MIISIILYITAFIAIWLGAGLIIGSVDRIARKLHLSSFAISFFLLGILTSIPETAISATAVLDGRPEIFVGTFLGGTIVIFLFIIPLLAILGKGIKINHELNDTNLILSLIVVATPSLLVIDHRVTNIEGALLLFLYFLLFYMVQKKHGIFDKNRVDIMHLKAYSYIDLIKMGLGVLIVYVASQYIVGQTIVFSQKLHVSPFYISLLLLSIGTNLPELSLAIRAVVSGKKDIAFGDYLGSAAANTLLFGFFTIMNTGEVITANNFLFTFLFTVAGLALFYYFSKSKHDISVREGIILLGAYLFFVFYESMKSIR